MAKFISRLVWLQQGYCDFLLLFVARKAM